MDIRVKMRDLIETDGRKQVTVAKAIGMTPAQLSAVLNLKRKVEADEFLSFCKYMGINPNDFKKDSA